MVAPVEVGEGDVQLLVGNGLLKQHEAGDRHAVGEVCLAALEQWAGAMAHGPWDKARAPDRAWPKPMDAQAY